MTQDRFKFRVWIPAFERMDQVDAIIFDIKNNLPQYAVEVQLRGTPEHYEIHHNLGPEYDNILMQSTGLKDKNGVLIFQDDILRLNEYIYRVCWSEKGCFVLRCPPDTHDFLFTNENLADYEKIGNIHEHPELLKAGV